MVVGVDGQVGSRSREGRVRTNDLRFSAKTAGATFPARRGCSQLVGQPPRYSLLYPRTYVPQRHDFQPPHKSLSSLSRITCAHSIPNLSTPP